MSNMGKAVAHMLVLADLYLAQGRQAEADQVLQAAQGMDPNNSQLQARMATAAEQEILPSLEEGAAAVFESEEIAGERFPEPDAPVLEDEISFGQPFETPVFDEDKQHPEEVAEAAPTAARKDPARPARPAPPIEEDVPAPPAEEIDLNEIWSEAEFYYQQGLFDEARKHYEKIIEYAPDNPRALARIAEIDRDQEQAQEFSKLADAVDELEGLESSFTGSTRPAPAAHQISSSSDEDAVRSLMQEIADLKQKPVHTKMPSAAPQAPSRQPAPPQPSARQSMAPADDDFFDLGAELNHAGSMPSSPAPARASGSSDDFFDLASELRDELSSVSRSAPDARPIPRSRASMISSRNSKKAWSSRPSRKTWIPTIISVLPTRKWVFWTTPSASSS